MSSNGAYGDSAAMIALRLVTVDVVSTTADPRSLSNLISRMRCGQKARMQGTRSAVWSFQISDEQRGRRAFWPQPAGRASLWAHGGVARALIVAPTPPVACALACSPRATPPQM